MRNVKEVICYVDECDISEVTLLENNQASIVFDYAHAPEYRIRVQQDETIVHLAN